MIDFLVSRRPLSLEPHVQGRWQQAREVCKRRRWEFGGSFGVVLVIASRNELLELVFYVITLPII